MSILVVGSLGLDTIETPFDKVENSLGGSAVYISISASYFSNQINLVGVVGGDFPQEYIDLLNSQNINLEGLQIIKDGRTFRWSGKYFNDMNCRETIFTELNVFKDFNPAIPDNYRNSEFVILGNIDPDLQINVLNQLNSPEFIVCDTMNYWIERKRESLYKLLKIIDMLVVNESEAKMLVDDLNLLNAGKKILKLGPKYLVIKKGEHGAVLMTNEFLFLAPAYPLEAVIDPTGAGDSFAGGMIGYLSRVQNINNLELKRAIVYGTVLASFCVQNFSVKGLLNLDESLINERVKEIKSITDFEL